MAITIVQVVWHLYRICSKQCNMRLTKPQCLQCRSRTNPICCTHASGSSTIRDYVYCKFCCIYHGEKARQELKVYRLYTEDMNREGIIAILDQQFKAYTITPTVGRWNGISESSLLIEVSRTTKEAVLEVSEAIREANKQEAVLIQEHEPSSTVLTRSYSPWVDIENGPSGAPSRLQRY